MKRTAFTLVELLVVISIIALLSTVAVAATSSARSKARDIKRLADLKQIKTAIDLYLETNGVAPQCGQINCTTPVTTWGDFTAITIKPAYMANIPTDPLNVARQYGYYYVAGIRKASDCTYVYGNSQDWMLATRLENPGNYPNTCPGGVAAAWDNTSINYLLSD